MKYTRKCAGLQAFSKRMRRKRAKIFEDQASESGAQKNVEASRCILMPVFLQKNSRKYEKGLDSAQREMYNIFIFWMVADDPARRVISQ